jgi:hypothetical protein
VLRQLDRLVPARELGQELVPPQTDLREPERALVAPERALVAPEQVLGPEQVPRQTDQLGPGPGQEPERVQVLRRVLHQPDRPVPAR